MFLTPDAALHASRTLAASGTASINTLVGAQSFISPSPRPLTVYDFDVIRILGEGGFAKVYEVELRDTKQRYALKVVDKLAKGYMHGAVKREKEIMQWLGEQKEQKALTLHASWQDEKNVYLLTVRVYLLCPFSLDMS